MQHNTIRRVLLLGGLTFAGAAGLLLADQADAHAADKKPAAVEQPGGLLHRAAQLPEQASDHAKAAVAKPKPKCEPGKKPDKPKKANEQPAPKPEQPAPADKPEPPKPPREDPAPADKPETPKPKPADNAPAPEPVELPSPPLPEKPAPTVSATRTAPPAPPALPVATALPAVIGPIATPATAVASPPPGPAVASLIATLTAGDPDQPALCPDDARPINALRALLGMPDEPPAAERTSKPCQPEPADNATNGATTATSGSPGVGLANGDIIGSHVPPALARLEHTRPRSTIPASRHTCIEPGPA